MYPAVRFAWMATLGSDNGTTYFDGRRGVMRATSGYVAGQTIIINGGWCESHWTVAFAAECFFSSERDLHATPA